jgi:hypothetical protein
LYRGDHYAVSLLTSEQVCDAASALAPIDKASLRARYDAIDTADYGKALSDDDFEYVWPCFKGLPQFFAKASAAERAMVFTVDF